jgi:hypothetical protein
MTQKDTRPTPHPDAKFVTVTPEIAREWLEKNESNRSPRSATVREYEQSMRDGIWRVTGDTIKFDKNGRLIDGQHRLLACARSGKPFQTYVVSGLSTEAYLSVDSGVKRNLGDVLSYAGMRERSVQLASAFKYAISVPMIEEGAVAPTSLGRSHLPVKTILEQTQKHQKEMLLSLRVLDDIGNKPFAPVTLFAALHFLFRIHHPEKTAAFFEELRCMAKGEDPLSVSSPVRALFKMLSALGNDGRQKTRVFYTAAVTIKAFSFYVQGAEVSLIRWGESEAWPLIPRAKEPVKPVAKKVSKAS